MRLDGKVALITGAGSGIGRAIATLFAQKGATVAIMGRRENVLEELLSELMSQGGDALVVSGDVSDPETCNNVGVVGERDLSAYCATKSGLNTFTKSIALDYGSKGIRANSISPAFVETDLNREHLAKLRKDKDKWQKVIDAHPLGRIGTPEDIANAARFLCSDEAGWITGINMPVDGGYLAK